MMNEEQKFINQLHENFIYFPVTGKVCRRRSSGNSLGTGKRFPAWSEVGSDNGKGYLKVGFNGKYFKVHRIAFALAYGYMPKEIDHKNRDRTDNRLVNLREVTRKQNTRNCGLQKNNTSGCVGVVWRKDQGKWQVALRNEFSQRKSHGFYNDFDDACEVAKAEKERVDKVLGV